MFGCNLVLATANAIPTGAWVIQMLDTSDVQGALGYHDIDTNGKPLAKIFVKDDMKYKLSWTVTLSHELIEMLVDATVNLTVLTQNGRGLRLWALEACDACEDDSFGYQINGVLVSDFVTRAFFEPGIKGPYDFCKHLTAPFQVAKGGYMGVLDLSSPRVGWKQVFAEGEHSARHTESWRRDKRFKSL